MTLHEWLDYLAAKQGFNIRLGLNRLAEVAKPLGLSRFSCPVIMVGGTNGKGSCIAALQSVCIEAGFQVAAYTSPHLLKFNERLRFQGIPVKDAMWIKAFQFILKQVNVEKLSYFEMITLAAFWLIKQHVFDILLLEVGLGGRLDAVNIVDADIAIITSIALDHMNWLGNDRESIGFEKAGIFRKEKIAICGDDSPPKSISRQANEVESLFYQCKKDFDYGQLASKAWWFLYGNHRMLLPQGHLPLGSLACAYMAITCLKKDFQFRISDKAIVKGLSVARLLGRFQQLEVFSRHDKEEKKKMITYLDVGHNPAAAQWVSRQLAEFNRGGKTYVILGMLEDKAIQETIKTLLPHTYHFALVSLNCERGASADQLEKIFNQLTDQRTYLKYDSVEEAYQAIWERAALYDRVLIFGSFHTVARWLETYGSTFEYRSI